MIIQTGVMYPSEAEVAEFRDVFISSGIKCSGDQAYELLCVVGKIVPPYRSAQMIGQICSRIPCRDHESRVGAAFAVRYFIAQGAR